MSCDTSFTVPYSNKEVSYKKMNCQQALKFIQDMNDSPHNYLSKVSIITYGKIFPSIDRYELLSRTQFVCLLSCAKIQMTKEHHSCKNSCHKKVEDVILNILDLKKFKKHPEEINTLSATP